MELEAVETGAVDVAGDRSLDDVLRRIVEGLAGCQPGVALARIRLPQTRPTPIRRAAIYDDRCKRPTSDRPLNQPDERKKP